MKNTIIYTSAFALLMSCASPSDNANKVCECNKKLAQEVKKDLNDINKTFKNIGKAFDNECIQMKDKFEKEYKESPEDLKEFRAGLSNCR